MEKMIHKLIVLILIASIVIPDCKAQDTDNREKVILWVLTNDGNEYVGAVQVRNSSEITLETRELGLITIPLAQIRKIREVDASYLEKRFPNVFTVFRTKYFTTQSAEMLSRNEGYYQNGLVLFNQAGYGISDHFTVGISTFIPTGVWINVKAGARVGNSVHLAGNVSLGTRLEQGPEAIGQFSGLITFSGERMSFTFGAGLVLEDGILRNDPSIQVAASYRTGLRGYVIAEFNALNAEDLFDRSFLIGGRTRLRKLSLDYGLGIVNDNSDLYFIPFPWVGVLIPL